MQTGDMAELCDAQDASGGPTHTNLDINKIELVEDESCRPIDNVEIKLEENNEENISKDTATESNKIEATIENIDIIENCSNADCRDNPPISSETNEIAGENTLTITVDSPTAAVESDITTAVLDTESNTQPTTVEPQVVSKPPTYTTIENELSVKDAPPDIKQLTIRNLDTGEEFIIGENDPDFDFDTFELCAGPHHEGEGEHDDHHDDEKKQRYRKWWGSLMEYIFAGRKRRMNQPGDSKSQSPKNHADDSKEPERPPTKTPFTKLSSFKFRKELGRGAFGRVLLAEAKTDGKLYALKIISKKNMRTSDKRQAKTERDILLAMGHLSPHPFTTGLRFAFQSENNLYLGMDFLPGGNLKELIRRYGCLPEDWVCLYGAELTLAISHLHSLNVIYRDIKPHNVMIDSRGHVILIDFGLSKQDISHPRGAMSLVGTPDYSAPEVLKTGVYQIENSNKNKKSGGGTAADKKKARPIQKPTPSQAALEANQNQDVPPHIGYGKAADWWSLGIMIFEMLGGTPTFRGADLRQTYQRVLYADVEFKPIEKFSQASQSLILGLLNKDPTQRLGAWTNPPRDIMDHEFFHSISWDEVFERKFDGPWVPEPVVFGKRASTRSMDVVDGNNMNHTQETTIENPEQPEEAIPSATSHKRTQSISQKAPSRKNSVAQSVSSVHSNNTNTQNDPNQQSELIQLRESILAFSKGHQNNRIADWSFFDESILKSVPTQLAPPSSSNSPVAGSLEK